LLHGPCHDDVVCDGLHDGAYARSDGG
jgi:hypothetical protein